jgi:hypothetical protein
MEEEGKHHWCAGGHTWASKVRKTIDSFLNLQLVFVVRIEVSQEIKVPYTLHISLIFFKISFKFEQNGVLEYPFISFLGKIVEQVIDWLLLQRNVG